MKAISTNDEAKLVRLLQKGDNSAFRVVYDYYWPVMYMHALRMLQVEDEAEDITQELFLTFYTRLPVLKADTSIGAWLFVTLRNKILNQIRNHRARRVLFDRWIQEELQAARKDPGPLEELQVSELEALIESEVRQMPERMRYIFELSRKEYLSHKEIAIRLQISDKTVKTQVNNALKILRSRLTSISTLIF